METASKPPEQFAPFGRPKAPDGDQTPPELRDALTWEPRRPVPLKRPIPEQPATGKVHDKHRLVVLGDSLSQGFKSLAISDTDNSWPAMVARYGGLGEFRRPGFDRPQACPGLPLNLEAVVRTLRFPETLFNVSEDVQLAAHLRRLMDRVEDVWEGRDGSGVGSAAAARREVDLINHNLASWGQDLRDALSLTVEVAARRISSGKHRGDNVFLQVPSAPMERAALQTMSGAGSDDSPVALAHALGEDGGIETLVVGLGANNILGTILEFEVNWTEDSGYAGIDSKLAYNAWAPRHFTAEFDQLLERVAAINARNVIVFTVPHVTIAPLARGVGQKMPGDRYFARYSRPWISDEVFNPNRHACITGQQMRVLDSAVDLYNAHIERRVAERDGRDGRGWALLDLAGMLDGLAYRRYLVDDEARPDWWQPYDLPEEYRAISPPLDTRFFRSDRFGRVEGGLFSLDGIHPTTAGYGLLAREVMNVMTSLKVPLARTQPDFADILARDTLVSDPPKNLATVLTVVEVMDRLIALLIAHSRPSAS